MIEINGKQFSDKQVMAEYKKRTSEYRKWRLQKATEFLHNKKRGKYYHCSVVSDADEEGFDTFMPLPNDIIARVRALKEEIANDPQLKTDEERDDVFHDRIDEIGQDIDTGNDPMMANASFTNIDPDTYIYLYHFDLHFFNEKESKNGQRVPASTLLTDEEYIELLAHLIDQPHCSFHHLAYLSPKLKAIHKKVDEDLHNLDFGVCDYFCHDHDYAVLMTELREDANKLLKQLKKKKEEYPYLNFLKDPIVNIAKVSMEQHAKMNGK